MFSSRGWGNAWSFPSSMSCQIHQRKKKNPHDIHEVPVKPCHFDRRVISSGKFPMPRQNSQRQQDENAKSDVNGMQTRHRKVEPEKNFSMRSIGFVPFKVRTGNEVLHEILMVLDALDGHEDDAQKCCAQE